MILHVDMDAFYASVEERDCPELVGKPVIVGGSREHRGVVSAANYVARQYGVHSALPMATALRYCPRAIVLPVRMDHYAAISRQIREIFHRYTPLVEPLSLDEAFLDARGSEQLFGTSAEIGRKIQQDIWNETQLVASIGVAPNKFLAKIASDFDKPNGFVEVPADGIHDFLDPLPVKRIWGVGKRAEEMLAKIGVTTVERLRKTPLASLRQCFGDSTANHLHELAHGRDSRNVVPDREAKSISHETTFPIDVTDVEILRSCLLSLTEQVARRLRRHKLYGRTIHLKVRYNDFRTISRAYSLPNPSHSTSEIWDAVSEHLLTRVDLAVQPVRLIGIGLSSLAKNRERQKTLFDDHSERDGEIDSATDAIKEKFGGTAIQRGSMFSAKRKVNDDHGMT
ncbi:MAG: DNA polymerase IV [Planctomycetota bacterium]|nr:DNA polymerase IV [Planctomycetota bacterium]MDA0918227.1 DNA polymerase IV [Planctomycetota bacterium]MDA1158223.1 DNA polymerase IV [Planctomycetota bacterium]